MLDISGSTKNPKRMKIADAHRGVPVTHVLTPPSHSSADMQTAVMPTSMFASGGQDGVVKLWDVTKTGSTAGSVSSTTCYHNEAGTTHGGSVGVGTIMRQALPQQWRFCCCWEERQVLLWGYRVRPCLSLCSSLNLGS